MNIESYRQQTTLEPKAQSRSTAIARQQKSSSDCRTESTPKSLLARDNQPGDDPSPRRELVIQIVAVMPEFSGA
jgi:hypothetical protein